MYRILIILVCCLLMQLVAFAQTRNIWDGTSCHHRVQLTAYPAAGSERPAVVVCPGGSYFWHDTETEGRQVARWLQSQGITAFVLRYRTAYVPAFIVRYRYLFRGNQYPDPQDDLRQALSLVRRDAALYGIDPQRVGTMGFSAGGHLVMSVAERPDSAASRPDFVVPVYPVVSFTEPCTHKRSRRALLGEWRKHLRLWRDSLSLERHVPADCPPVFLVNCQDDPVVDYHNSELLDSALTVRGVPHVYLQYATGGHGFGASEEKGSAESRQWKDAFLQWLRREGFLESDAPLFESDASLHENGVLVREKINE